MTLPGVGVAGPCPVRLALLHSTFCWLVCGNCFRACPVCAVALSPVQTRLALCSGSLRAGALSMPVPSLIGQWHACCSVFLPCLRFGVCLKLVADRGDNRGFIYSSTLSIASAFEIDFKSSDLSAFEFPLTSERKRRSWRRVETELLKP